jgi:hypothetical protein
MAFASEDVAGIGSVIDHACAAAAEPTTGVVAAAADEVSAGTATLFNTFGLQYQAVITQARVFLGEFVRALGAAGNAYAEAESANAARVSEMSGAPDAAAQSVALVMGGTGTPLPSQRYVTNVFEDYVAHNMVGVSLSDTQPLLTPESFYPVTGVKTLPLNQSVNQGMTTLNDAILQEISAGNNVTVVGYSQSAVISSLEMQVLPATPNPPSPGQLSFVLLGDPMNPNGGMMSRFPGLTIRSLGVEFYGATPTNTTYPTHVYTIEYDGFADFPRYPIDVLADLNAVAGIPYAHGQYANLPGTLVATAVTLPTDPAYGTATTYSMIPTANLPLLDPVRSIPVIGNPLADLLQPDLTYLVNWGFGNPAYGYSTGPANVPTPFGILPPLSDTVALGGDLVTGTQQGIGAFLRDVAASRFPSVSEIVSDSVNVFTSTPMPTLHLPTGLGVVEAVSRAASTASATLLRTADIADALLTSIPSYDINLFLDGITQAATGDPGGLVNAFGNPIVADTGLITIIGGTEGLALIGAAQSIAADFAGLL